VSHSNLWCTVSIVFCKLKLSAACTWCGSFITITVIIRRNRFLHLWGSMTHCVRRGSLTPRGRWDGGSTPSLNMHLRIAAKPSVLMMPPGKYKRVIPLFAKLHWSLLFYYRPTNTFVRRKFAHAAKAKIDNNRLQQQSKSTLRFELISYLWRWQKSLLNYVEMVFSSS